MHVINNPDEFRSKLKVFNEKLNSIIYSTNLEIGIFNYCLKEAAQKKIIRKWENTYFVELYIDRFRSIFMNLQKTDLLKDIQNKKIKPEDVAFMTHQEMNLKNGINLLKVKLNVTNINLKIILKHVPRLIYM